MWRPSIRWPVDACYVGLRTGHWSRRERNGRRHRLGRLNPRDVTDGADGQRECPRLSADDEHGSAWRAWTKGRAVLAMRRGRGKMCRAHAIVHMTEEQYRRI